MLYIRTGLPGAGKTLNAIREIDLEHQPDPDDPTKRLHKNPDDPDAAPRTIYYHGIPELKSDRLKSKWVEFDTPDRWFELPDGSVIVIDEAQGTFGTDIGRSRVDKVTRFETHRHQGLDIHLITQHPSLLAPAVRKLAGKHVNFFRPYGRQKGVFRHEYEMCIDSPEKRANFKLSQESKVELDASYFGVYKSSTVHTHKPVRPAFLKLIPIYAGFILLMLCLLVGVGWYVVDSAEDTKTAIRDQSGDAPAEASQAAGTGGGRLVSAPAPVEPEPVDYVETYAPRITGIPQSAPRYDDLNKPRDFPRLHCVSSTDERTIERQRKRGQVAVIDGEEIACQCYTQQGTRVATTVETCVDVVENGIFDDTRTPRMWASGQSPNGLTTQSGNPVDIPRGPAAGNQPGAFQTGGISVSGIDNTRGAIR